jgi:adenine deaminase
MTIQLASPRTPAVLRELMDAGRRTEPADLLLAGGTVLDVYRGSWHELNVAVTAGRVVALTSERPDAKVVHDVSGRRLVPGLFDPHFHAGGCHLSPARLAEALLARGTTTTVCDFQEHYANAGPDAVRAAIDEAQAAGLRIKYLVPLQQFVIHPLGVTGHDMHVDDLRRMLDWPETVAINEPPPGALFAKGEDTLEIVSEALRRGLIYSGHAPELSGDDLQAYVATGPSSDHESADADAAWMKLGLGMKVILRQGSAARDLPQLVSLAREQPLATRHMSLGTDEVDPIDLSADGHQDAKVRYVIEHGVDPVVAIQMVTLNPAEYYRIDHDLGSLAPGRIADIVVLDDLERFAIADVYASGQRLDRDHVAEVAPPAPAAVRSRVNLGRRMTPQDFHVPADGPRARVRVIEVPDGSLVSGAGEEVLGVAGGGVLATPERDVLKVAAIEPHRGTAATGVGFVRGIGLRDAAVATTYNHPFFSVLTIGTSDSLLAGAANRLAEIGGGLTIVTADGVAAEWPLPVVGVFDDAPLAVVRERFEHMNEALRRLGCTLKAPVLALSFTALVTIPAYGLSSKGLYDVVAASFVPTVIESVA